MVHRRMSQLELTCSRGLNALLFTVCGRTQMVAEVAWLLRNSFATDAADLPYHSFLAVSVGATR